MAVFHELDLLVLRPFVKKKKLFAHAPPSACARHFQNAQSHWELKNKSWIRKFGKHLHEGPKNTRQNENSKFEIYFLTYKHLKKGIFKGASPDGKNKFFKKFLTFIEKYMSFGVEPPLGEFEKVFC